MDGRDRATGWQHAKLTGHENESLLEKLVKSDKQVQENILRSVHCSGCAIIDIDFGGINESNVPSILGDTTKSKTDMHITLSNNTCINVSIKKSTGGQVYLIGVNRFINGFEQQYDKVIPKEVKRAISLYWGSAADTIEIVNKYAQKCKLYELRKHRLVATTLQVYDTELSRNLIQWFNDNIDDIFDFCFSKGLAKNSEDWADIVWYKNELHENVEDRIFNIKDVKAALPKTVEFGTRTNGSTIQLPFGFVQWHSPKKIIPGQMQFHHSYEKLKSLL